MITLSRNQSEDQLKALYQSLLDNWNNNDATSFAKLFSEDGDVIGFDGSQMKGPNEIESELTKVFSNHKVSSYISIIREVRPLSSSIYLLRAVVGMVPPGQNEINPKVNAIQSMIACIQTGEFKIVLFQNTPAAFHGREQLSSELTQELQKALNHQKKNSV
jgi:uncharacterized protein (TIGR02246 family)